MYDIRQFRTSLYVVLLIGVSGFCLAAESPGLWLLSAIGIGLNWWLVSSGRFVPMPRLLANLVSLISVSWVILLVRAGDSTPILTVGRFLVLLHLVKLYEQRANRDVATMLVLSLLLMVAAAISTASLAFGMMMVAYLFIALYCCLLFHLKVETEAAKAAFGMPEEQINPETLRQDQRYLPRSMRRLTWVVSLVSVVMAVVVFVFFPRGAGAGLFGPLQLHPSQTLSGFSDHMGFQKVAQITRNNAIAAYVTVYKNGQRGQFGTLLLRGTTLDLYTGDGESEADGRWQWLRLGEQYSRSPNTDSINAHVQAGATRFLGGDAGADVYRQEIYLLPTGTSTLFAMAGITNFSCTHDIRIKLWRRDGVLIDAESLLQPLQYTVESTGQLYARQDPAVLTRDPGPHSRIDPRIKEYASRPDVSGVDGNGVGLARRPLNGDHSRDADILHNIETHLQTKFTYTLDLTDARGIHEGEDPMVGFLYNFKRGHCEYFAGAMALMCQSLNIPARVVTGFKSDEYNDMGGYYIVRQSHAHAWVEASIDGGLHWQTYDPTSGRDAGAANGTGLLATIKNLYNLIEFKWANSVVAYDRGDRENLMNNLTISMDKVAVRDGQRVPEQWKKLSNWWDQQWGSVTSVVVGAAIAMMIAAGIFFVIYYLWERWRLRQRARRIGLETLPLSDRQRLLRQLVFYDDLVQLLERHRMVRPRQFTPLEFSASLKSFMPNDIYDQVHRLTWLFYRVRYGRASISFHRQRRLATVVAHLAEMMENRDEYVKT